METKKTPKKSLKKKRKSSKTVVTDSDDSDHEITDFNGISSILNDVSNDSDEGWTTDDDQELVRKVKETTKDSDKVSYKTRLKQLDWKTIAFKGYSADNCEQRFQSHLKHIRRHRNLSEITADIETNIKKCPVKKPLNAYQLFVQDQLTNVKSSGDFSETMKNLATSYKELPPEEQAGYKRRADQLLEEYRVRKLEFKTGVTSKASTGTPLGNKAKTPFMLYAESKQLDEPDTSKLRANYANLSLEEKYKWVVKAVSEAQNASQEDITKILNKEELRIFKGQAKFTPSAYSLYVKDAFSKTKQIMGDKKESAKDVFTQIALQWKSLDPKKKKIFNDSAAILREKAALEQEEFNERHGVTPKRKAQRRKSVFVENPPEIPSDEEDAVDHKPKGPAKGRKRKNSTVNPNSDDESDSYRPNTKQIKLKSPAKAGPSKANASITETQAKTPVKQSSPVKAVHSSSKPKSSPAAKPKPSPLAIKTNSSPVIKTPADVKKELKFTSESSEPNDTPAESDAAHNDSRSAKKKAKKEKKSKKEKKLKEIVEPPGEKPPSDLFKYFEKHVHTGKPHKAQKAFDKLPKKERKQLVAEYNDLAQAYVTRLKLYLKSLPKEEALVYMDQVKAADEAEKGENGGAESSQEY